MTLEFHTTVALEEGTFIADRTLGRTPAPIVSRVSMGVITGQPVTVDRASTDADTQSMLRLLDERDYYLLAFVCTLAEEDDEHIDRAKFTVSLTSANGVTPIVWSIDPAIALAPPRSVSTTRGREGKVGVSWKLDAGLKLISSHTESFEPEEWNVMGLGLGQSNPEWKYQRRETRTLEGDHTMKLVAQVPQGAGLDAVAELTATITRPRFGRTFARATVPGQEPPETMRFSIG